MYGGSSWQYWGPIVFKHTWKDLPGEDLEEVARVGVLFCSECLSHGEAQSRPVVSVLLLVLELGALLHTLQHLVAPYSSALALSCLFLGRIFLLFFWFCFSLTSSPEAPQAPLRFTEAAGLTIAAHTGLLAAAPACGIQHPFPWRPCSYPFPFLAVHV